MSYYRWSLGNDIPFFLELVKSDGTGLTGSDPQVMVRRYKSTNGVLLDNYYWNSASFVSTAVSHSMVEVDPTNNPGLYTYMFSQSLVQAETVYNVYFKHNATPIGFSTERHVVATSASLGDVNVYESEVD